MCVMTVGVPEKEKKTIHTNRFQFQFWLDPIHV